ncbi:ribulose-phosphate 3-epimerase [Eubacteriales bacterium OttesenSCG-928-N13]|nr:ribulose-phosphate 3-epimerase [Eubacteriales bacterium OttesenSCG-928-N13]
MAKVAASLLAADILHLEDEILRMQQAGVDALHYDVMDGIFVPNISFGWSMLEQISGVSRLPLDVHLMIAQPERYIEKFAKAGARTITVHVEATNHLHRVLEQIRDCGCLAGVSLNPATSPETLQYVLGEFDQVLAMTVNPGFGGQSLIPQVVTKVGEIKKMLVSANVEAEIEVDGGVDTQSAPHLVRQGATLLVTGSALFRAPDAAAFVQELHAL